MQTIFFSIVKLFNFSEPSYLSFIGVTKKVGYKLPSAFLGDSTVSPKKSDIYSPMLKLTTFSPEPSLLNLIRFRRLVACKMES
jgi:hypothetical protein